MSDDDTKLALPDLEGGAMPPGGDRARRLGFRDRRTAAPPISKRCSTCRSRCRPCSGSARMDVGELLKLGPGAVLELDRKVGEAIDIYVNDRLVARGEVVLVEDKLGVTMTEIIKAER